MANEAKPDLASVVRLSPVNVGTGEHELDSARVEAREHLEFFDWVLSVKGEYLGCGAEGIIYGWTR